MVSWEMEGTYLCVGCKKYLEGSSRHRSEAVTHELHVEIRGISKLKKQIMVVANYMPLA